MGTRTVFLVLLLITEQIKAVSYNQPRFCSMASWTPDAKTFADNATVSQNTYCMFIDKNNTVYIAAQGLVPMKMWLEEGILRNNTIFDSLSHPLNIFVGSNNEIYTFSISTGISGNGSPQNSSVSSSTPTPKSGRRWWCYICFFWTCCIEESMPGGPQPETSTNTTLNQTSNNSYHGSVHKWSLNTTNFTTIMSVNGFCFNIFIDVNETIYCSMPEHHRVVAKSKNVGANESKPIAGTGVNGSNSTMLNYPSGIFVSTNFSLYVADSFNDRIQRFDLNNPNGTTIVGHKALRTMNLSFPTGVILDGDHYLFIVDSNNHRVVGSGPNGFRCLVGCSESGGSAANQLLNPITLGFDSYGNILVLDTGNNRIQKFLLATNSCDLSYNQPKLCPSASWSSNATIFADNTTIQGSVYGLFVDASNTVYATGHPTGNVHVWASGSSNVSRSIFLNTSLQSKSIFVTLNGEIFIDNGENSRIERWSKDTKTNVPLETSNKSCYGLFIDLNNTIYCSARNLNVVIKKSLRTNNETFYIAAGNKTCGSASTQLCHAHGIFVDANFTLYVADTNNSRIQRFSLGDVNGTTVVSNETSVEIDLRYPTGIVLDADRNMFIIEERSLRIIRWTDNSSYCLVGCGSRQDPILDQIQHPRSPSFDSYGNIYVADMSNGQIQKFILMTNFCDETVSTFAALTSVPSTSVRATSVSSTSTPSTSVPSALLSSVSIPSTFVPSTTTASEDTEYGLISTILSTKTNIDFTTSNVPTTEVSNTVTTTMNNTTAGSSPSDFFQPVCNGHTASGVDCKKLTSICYLEAPCYNSGSCKDNDTIPKGYSCSCLPDFDGDRCEHDHRLCKADTCWNYGICTSDEFNVTFVCHCHDGWTGQRCETKVNYCQNITCYNNGVCRSLFKNYSCECLGDNYFGQHCEETATKIVVFQIVSKSFAYIGIVAMVSVIVFIVVMDVLKYCFGIDPVREERERLRREREIKRRTPVIQRFIYVNKPPSDETLVETSTEATV